MHRKKGRAKRYGFFALIIDLISIPISIALWVIEKTIHGCQKIMSFN